VSRRAKARTRWGTFSVSVVWTNWYVGFWFWPVSKDLTFGVNFGPVTAYWTR